MTGSLEDDLAFLRVAHPSFVSVADTLVDLAADESVSPEVYDRVCEAVFTVLTAWAMNGKEVRLDA